MGPPERALVALLVFFLWLSSVNPAILFVFIALIATGSTIVWRHSRPSRCGVLVTGGVVALALAVETYLAALVVYVAIPPMVVANPQDAALLAARPNAESARAVIQMVASVGVVAVSAAAIRVGVNAWTPAPAKTSLV